MGAAGGGSGRRGSSAAHEKPERRHLANQHAAAGDEACRGGCGKELSRGKELRCWCGGGRFWWFAANGRFGPVIGTFSTYMYVMYYGYTVLYHYNIYADFFFFFLGLDTSFYYYALPPVI